MPRFLIKDQSVEVTELEFPLYLKNWVEGCENLGIGLIHNHTSGLADFSGNYYGKMHEIFRAQTAIIEPEVEGYKFAGLFHEFIDLIEKIWIEDQEMVDEYAKALKINLSFKTNRRKLNRMVYRYRFGDLTKGTECNVPESVVKIGKRSYEILLPEFQKVSADLIAEIDKTLPANHKENITLE